MGQAFITCRPDLYRTRTSFLKAPGLESHPIPSVKFPSHPISVSIPSHHIKGIRIDHRSNTVLEIKSSRQAPTPVSRLTALQYTHVCQSSPALCRINHANRPLCSSYSTFLLYISVGCLVYFHVLVLVLVLPLKCRELEKNATTSRQPGATPPLPSFSQDTPDSCGCGSPLSLSLFEEV